MKKIELGKTGEKISVVGQGTWGLQRGKSLKYYTEVKQCLHRGIELGMNHIDTAEAYGWGRAESLVGEVAKSYNRDDLFITSKLFPVHMTCKGMKKAAYKSLENLNLKYLDLYLVHWPNPLISVAKQMKVMEELVNEGNTRYIGVSNFSVNRIEAAQKALRNVELVNNQVRCNVLNQHHIRESLPYLRENGITLTAYSPLGHKGFRNVKGRLRESLELIAHNHKATIQQIALAWLINIDNVITIPKAFQIKHVEVNALAADIVLSSEEMDLLADNSIPG
ncbi:MAG: aldo/keto reductase [Theionarchaea archaeon]|nr:aldo/keto reductase [Theionarchaea archaeon]